MKRLTLDEHIAQSKIAAAANKIKGNRHGHILSMLYSEPFHFVEELLQNAEDAFARSQTQTGEPGMVRIEISENGIDFFHNGDPFSDEDLMAITTFASTTKTGQPGINKIGKFGIGFRSVFGFCDQPEIHSGDKHYSIHDYEVLHKVSPVQLKEFSTLIRMPWGIRATEELRTSLSNRLFSLNASVLLFLSQIQQIDITDGVRSLTLAASSENHGLFRRIQLSAFDQDKTITDTFLIHRHPSKDRICIALPISNNGDFSPRQSAPVSVYFPTKMTIPHSVFVHGRFTTTPNRENIPFQQDLTPENFVLLEHLATQLRGMLHALLRSDIINPSFFNLFNWTAGSSDPISETIMQCLSEFIANEKVIMDADGKRCQIGSLGIAEDFRLLNLLSKRELKSVFHRAGFISDHYDQIPEFVAHLRNKHKLKLIDLDTFCFHWASTPGALAAKKTGWFIQFFSLLSSYPRYWDVKHSERYYNLRFKPCIPDSKKILHAPFNHHGQACIFIGKPAKGVPVVHPDLINNSESFDFLRTIGIPSVQPALPMVEQLLAKFNPDKANHWWLNMFELYNSSDSDLKIRIRHRLADMQVVPVTQSISGEKLFSKPGNSYIQTASVLAFFRNIPALLIRSSLISSFIKHGISGEATLRFLLEIGLHQCPRIIEHPIEFSEEQKANLRIQADIHPIVKETFCDVTLDGLESFLKAPELQSSAALWNMLCLLPQEQASAFARFESYIRSADISFTPTWLSKLQQKPWVFNQKLDAVVPANISVSDLHPLFHNGQQPAEWMIRNLGFASGVISNEEAALLGLLRKHRTSAESLKGMLEKPQHPVIQWNGISSTHSKTGGQDPLFVSQVLVQNIASALSISHSSDWTSHLLSLPDQLVMTHLVEEVYVKSAEINIVRNKPGCFSIVRNNIILQHIFAGLIPSAGEAVFFHENLTEMIRSSPERKDIQLYIFNAEDGLIMHVRAENLRHFLTSVRLASISTNFIRYE